MNVATVAKMNVADFGRQKCLLTFKYCTLRNSLKDGGVTLLCWHTVKPNSILLSSFPIILLLYVLMWSILPLVAAMIHVLFIIWVSKILKETMIEPEEF